MLPLASSNF